MVETISIAILKKVLPVIAKKTGESVAKKYQELRAKIANSSHEYDQNYRKRHGQLKVFCAGMREPISLDDVYVAVQFLGEESVSKYRSPEEIEKAFRQRHLGLNLDEEQLSPSEKQNKRQDGTKVANEKQYLMVLGGPGVGKSTFLRKVGLEALKEKEGDFAHECIPVFLELKRFTEDQIDIEVLIAKEFEICSYPHPEEIAKTALESGKLLILFDGLDEVPTANVDNVIRKIGDFVDRYSQNRFIASCRIAAYTGGFTRFTEVEMANFDDSQVKAYINNWFESTSDPYRRQLDAEMETAEQCWKELNETEHQSTKELARNPLLLTLLCMVYDNTQNFPRNRASLYEDALNIFLREWAAEKRIRRDSSVSQYLDISDEKRMLSEIAAKYFEVNRVLFNENELINQIQAFGKGSANIPPTFNPSKILKTITVEQGLFVERINRFYSFSHLTFQEYLTANYIAGDARSIKGLVTDHLYHDGWREVFFLTAGLMREADHLLEQMQTEAAKFITTDRLKALFRWATCITDTPDASYSGIAKRAFAIHQFFSLWRLNKMSETIENTVNQFPVHNLGFSLHPEFVLHQEPYFDLNRDLNYYRDLYQDLNRDLDIHIDFYQEPYQGVDLDLYLELSLYPDLYQSVDPGLRLYQDPHPNVAVDIYHDVDLYQDLYLNLDLYFKIILNGHQALYQNRYPELYPNPNLYQDLYRYIDTTSYPPVFTELSNRFLTKLSRGTALVKRMEQVKIFKGVDLQRLVQKFNEQLEFIKAARIGKSIAPPEESIHETWLSVLDITDDMLAISHEEMESYIQYLRAVDLIVECKEAAGRVTPAIWKRIEDQLLAWDTEDIED